MGFSLPVVVLLVACSATDGSESPAIAPAPAPPRSAPAAPAPREVAKLTCDRVVSRAVRQKFFAGRAIRDVPIPPSGVACEIADGMSIEVDCPEPRSGTTEAIEAERESDREVGMKPLANVGASAVISHPPARTHVIAYADDSCRIEILVSDELDAIALVKQLLAELPRKR